MLRRLFLIVSFLAACHPCFVSAQVGKGEIITDDLAAQHGLTRSWMTQVEMDSGRSRLKFLLLHDGILYVQTDQAVIHAIDAETGATLWARQIGRPEHPTLTPGIGGDLLAVINGSRLYVANRFNGKILLETNIDGAPGAGPAVSDQRIYVPTVSGILLAYRIEKLSDPKQEVIAKNPISPDEFTASKSEVSGDFRLSPKITKPLAYQAKGRLLVQPLVTKQDEAEEYVVWPTDQGYMYIGRINRAASLQIEMKYRLQTAASITAAPTYLSPDPAIRGDSGIILAASGDGYIHAIQEKTGEPLWRFSTGEPLSQPAAVIDDRVYAATPRSGLYCINIKTGKKNWHAPSIVQFVAASKNRVYGVDKPGTTVILDAATGASLDSIPTTSFPIKLLNADTDRIYLATAKGRIQCLHEIDLAKPVLHNEARKIAAKKTAKATDSQKSTKHGAEEKSETVKAAPEEKANDAEKPAADDAAKNDKEKDPFSE